MLPEENKYLIDTIISPSSWHAREAASSYPADLNKKSPVQTMLNRASMLIVYHDGVVME